MSSFPSNLDDDSTLPRVDNSITEEGAQAINAQRDAIFSMQNEMGLGSSGSAGSLAARLGVSLNPDGSIKSSALTALGLVTLPITNAQVAGNAGIQESKLALDHPTSSLFGRITSINSKVETALNFIVNHGSKLEPHLIGDTYRHVMNHINIDSNVNKYFKNKAGVNRDNTNLYTVFNDLNNEVIAHEKANGTNVPALPASGYAHNAAGIHIDPSRFSFIPQATMDLQQFAEFVDNSNVLLLGTRIQTLYQNGIPRTSVSSTLSDPSHGKLIVPLTTVKTYLLNLNSSAPVDNIDNGDDLVEFTPNSSNDTTNLFDSQFASVRIGDILSINYGSFTTQFLIKEVKYSPSPKKFVVRINGKNAIASTVALAQINRPLFNTEKYGVLALASAQPNYSLDSGLPSLIVGTPRGAQVLGNGFNASSLNSSHYNLYLTMYSTGNPEDGSLPLPPIDITGNKGATPGAYTLESIVNATNQAFRSPGYNYRFIAYSYKGNFGIMLADAFGAASFSINSGILNSSGTYDQSSSNSSYVNNVVDVFTGLDALGFGPAGANVASPPYASAFSSVSIAQTPTKIFSPLKSKTFFVNGAEKERLSTQPNQILDTNGDGYWPGFISNQQILGNRVKTTYQVNLDLTSSGIAVGKSLVVQKMDGYVGSYTNYGRFLIEDVQFNSCNCDGYTDFANITVYDAVHGTGVSPYASLSIGSGVSLYFDGESVGFNLENVSDQNSIGPFKRHMEILINQDGYTFSHERARLNISGTTQTINGVSLYGSTTLNNLDLYSVSPKLKGYKTSNISKITLAITSLNIVTGNYDGYLCNYDGTTITQPGPLTSGKKGKPVRFYDNTYVDYIDFIFDKDAVLTNITSNSYIDIQLFSTLSLDDEVMLLGSCQVNSSTKAINYVLDKRQFGNVSEKQLSTSALDYISANDRILFENGIIQGFDIMSAPALSSTTDNSISFSGGEAFINGSIVNINPTTIKIPFVLETIPGVGTPRTTMSWFICANADASLTLIASTDYYLSDAPAYGIYDESRLFYVYDPANGLTTPSNGYYNVRAGHLSGLLKQKDIVPVAFFTAIVNVSGTTATFSSPNTYDLRRYIDNGNSGMNGTYTIGSNGNFRTLQVFEQWSIQINDRISSLKDKNTFGIKAIIKGSIDSGVAAFLTSSKQMVIEGGSIVINNINNGIALGANVSLRNIDFIINVDGNAGLVDDFNNSVLRMGDGSSNIIIENCRFFTGRTVNGTAHLGNNLLIVCRLGSLTSSIDGITIRNNKFINNNSAANKSTIIGFISDLSSNDGSSVGPTIKNITIEGNVCNKDNMIMVSSTVYTGVVQSALVTNNVRIARNVCGAINFLNRNTPGDVLTITGNTCKFIFNGYADGTLFNGGQSAPFRLKTSNNGTGNIVISDNSTSSIVVSDTSNTNPASLVIKNNMIIAGDPAFLTPYYNGQTITSIAIIVLYY